jgi:hypothetical protein
VADVVDVRVVDAEGDPVRAAVLVFEEEELLVPVALAVVVTVTLDVAVELIVADALRVAVEDFVDVRVPVEVTVGS